MAILPPDPIFIYKGDMAPVHALYFRTSPYIEHLYAGTELGNIHIWDLSKHRQVCKLESIKQQCMGLNIMNDEYLLALRKGGAIDLWNADGSNWIFNKTIQTDYYGFSRCEVLTNDIVLLPLAHSCVGGFSIKTQEIIFKLDNLNYSQSKSSTEVMAIKKCTFDNNIVLIAYENGTVTSWDIRKNTIFSSLTTDSCPMSLNFDDYFMKGVIGNTSNNLEVFSFTKNQLAHKTFIPLKYDGTSIIASRSDSKVFAAGGWDGRIRIFSWKTLRPLAVLNQHKSCIFDIVYSQDKVESYNKKYLMAAASGDGTVSLWDIYNQTK